MEITEMLMYNELFYANKTIDETRLISLMIASLLIFGVVMIWQKLKQPRN